MKHCIRVFIASFLAVALSVSAFAALSVESPADCVQCGMNRTAFAHSRALVEYQGGKVHGICSINCAVVDIKKNQGSKLKSIKVADFGSSKLIDATTAFWVIGGDVDGVMTPVAKWAFARKLDAQKFVKDHGGWQAPYKEVLQAVNEELEFLEKDKGAGAHKHKHH
jgi:nitrous oxide reductase accessory protein NosL